MWQTSITFLFTHIQTDLVHEKKHIFYTDGREGRRERCRQRHIPKSVCEGPGGRQCWSGIFYAFCVAGEKIIAECWRSSGHPTCHPVILFLPSVTRPLFVLLSSLTFFLPVSSIQPVNKLKILSLLPLKVPLTLILSFFPSQNLLLHGFWNTIFSWFTLSYLTSFFFFLFLRYHPPDSIFFSSFTL